MPKRVVEGHRKGYIEKQSDQKKAIDTKTAPRKKRET